LDLRPSGGRFVVDRKTRRGAKNDKRLINAFRLNKNGRKNRLKREKGKETRGTADGRTRNRTARRAEPSGKGRETNGEKRRTGGK
jgi:hypothetical protein